VTEFSGEFNFNGQQRASETVTVYFDVSGNCWQVCSMYIYIVTTRDVLF